jgi:hypothetical protein
MKRNVPISKILIKPIKHNKKNVLIIAIVSIWDVITQRSTVEGTERLVLDSAESTYRKKLNQESESTEGKRVVMGREKTST